jgi:hypothetical protein
LLSLQRDLSITKLKYSRLKERVRVEFDSKL